MQPRPSKSDSSATLQDLRELDLPLIGPEDAPVPHPPPSFEARVQHARFLLASRPGDFYEKRRARMNPEPFRME